MPHSLRVRLKNLNYKGLLTDREVARLCKALDTADAIENIQHDIKNQLFVGRLINHYEFDEGLKWCLEIIDKHISGKEQNESKTDS